MKIEKRNLIIATVCLLLGSFVGFCAGDTKLLPDQEFKGQRYKVIRSSSCYKQEDNENCFAPRANAWDIDRFHDILQGTDFICVYADHEMSCFQVINNKELK